MASVELRQRTISAIVLIAAALIATWGGGLIATLMIAALGMVGMYEWIGMTDPAAPELRRWRLAAAIGAVMLVGFGAGIGSAAVLAVLLACAEGVMSRRRESPRAGRQGGAVPADHRTHVFWTLFGFLYLSIGCLSLAAIREEGALPMLYLLIVVWGTDIGAYFAGRLIGGPKLAPKISPSKTWAGFFGGIAMAVILGYAAGRDFAVLLSAVLAVVAQLGDLFESWLKRRSGIKDSGRLIPGHGGVLDRIDSLMAAAIFLFLFIFTVIPRT